MKLGLQRSDPAVLLYRCFVVAYAVILPIYFHYRFVHSIVPMGSALGFYQWSTCLLELYGACNVLLLGFIRFRVPWASATPRPPQLPEHVFWAQPREDEEAAPPSESGPYDVAVLIPCYSEPDDVIFGTVKAALALCDPLASRVRVVLCDDGNRSCRAERLERLSPASHGRTIYASRPKDPTVPRHGKAGNLNHALRHVLYPEGVPPANALVVVFDCDMEAHGDFLAHTLPYMATQPRTALVQTPQTFYNVVPSADIFNHHNLTFYQAMQPGLDAWGATVCCGTNFVARASALYEVGYFPIESITEDYLLSLKLATAGWTVRFHAATVCTGEAPEDLRQIFKQRNRWCCGCFQVFLHPSLPRWLVGLARRSPVKAVCWINAPLSYLGTLLTVPLWAVVPALSLYANVHPVKALTPSLVLLWLAYFYLLVLLTEMMPSRLNRLSAAFLASKCNGIFWFCFAQAFWSAIVGRIFPAQAKQFEVTEKRGFSADAELTRSVAAAAMTTEQVAHMGENGPLAAAADEEEEERGYEGGLGGGGGGGGGGSGGGRGGRGEEGVGVGGVGGGEGVRGGVSDSESEATGSTAVLSHSDVLAPSLAPEDSPAVVPATSGSDSNGKPAEEAAILTATVSTRPAGKSVQQEEPRDSSQVDVIFHQLVLSAEALLLLAGLLHRAFAPPVASGAHALPNHVGGSHGGGPRSSGTDNPHPHVHHGDARNEDGDGGAAGPANDHVRMLSGGGGGSSFWSWQQLGLVLVPAAWLLINMVPNCMALAYAYLPHAHRVQTGAVRAALRAHSYLLFFVSVAMVQAAFLHGLASHSSAGGHHHAIGGAVAGMDVGGVTGHHALGMQPLAATPPAFATRSEAEAWEQQTEWLQALERERATTP